MISGPAAWAEIDLAALRRNVGAMADAIAPARLCAVVKANAYGHGMVPVARAAIEAGAHALAVVSVDEGAELRAAGIEVPVFLLGEPLLEEAREAVTLGLVPLVSSREGLECLANAAGAAPGGRVRVHLKVDTGMHRLGCAPEEALELVAMARPSGALRLEGIATHLPVGEGITPEDREFTERQLACFEQVAASARAIAVDPLMLHAANSAAALFFPRSRYDLVRSGIVLYGEPPLPGLRAEVEARLGAALEPVLSLKARVAAVRRLPHGARPSYGRRAALEGECNVATVPIGYADGVPRRLFVTGASVLVRGRRRPLAGMVTMNHVLVDCGDDEVAVGDEVVLLGSQGGERILAEDWAERLGTISYEVLTGVSPRLPRIFIGESP